MGQLKSTQIVNNSLTGASFNRNFGFFDEMELCVVDDIRHWQSVYWKCILNIASANIENDLSNSPDLDTTHWVKIPDPIYYKNISSNYGNTENWMFDILEVNAATIDIELDFRTDLVSAMDDGDTRFIFNPSSSLKNLLVKTSGIELDDSIDTVIIHEDGYLEFTKIDDELKIIRAKNISRGSSSTGTGNDGDIVLSAPTIVNVYTTLTGNRASGSTTLVLTSATGFSAGDEVLIHQTQDATNGNAGSYEFATIQSILSNVATLISPISNNYYSGTFGGLSNEATQVVRVPNYNSLKLQTGAGISSTAWVSANGYGGIVAFRVKTDLIFETGNLGVDVSEQGFLGGRDNGGGNKTPGDPGESEIGFGWLNNPNNSNCDANGSGGGGGYGPSSDSGTAGGGGGHKTAGGDAIDGNSPPALAQGGDAVGDEDLVKIFFGGAGGGGGDDDNRTTPGPYGGNSGGIVYIESSSSSDTLIKANGGIGISAGSSAGGDGGGGAGGTIFLQSLTFTSDSIKADGGIGGSDTSGDVGGNGSIGRVNIPSPSTSASAEILQLVKTSTQAISNGVDSYITWDNAEFTNTNYSWSGSVITINKKGTYLFMVEGTAELVSGNTRSVVLWSLELDDGTGYAQLPGTVRGSYHRQDDYDYTSISIIKIITAEIGHKIRFVAVANKTNVQTLDNGCHLIVEKK